MNIEYLQTKKVGILGYGTEGKSIAKYLIKHGIQPVLFDNNINSVADSGLEHYTAESYLNNINKVEVLFRSPGVWRLQPELLSFINSGGIITSQLKFFLDNCPSKIIGVTGTKGKGTTTTLAYQIAINAGLPAYLTGNIGLIQPLDFLDDLTGTEFVFFEMSSFQLQDAHKSPYIATVLMITKDHLDQHATLTEYHQAKGSITEFQSAEDFVIINADFPASVSIGSQSHGTKLWYGSNKIDFGIEIANKQLHSAGLEEFNISNQILLNLNEIKLRGEHNLQNIAAAILIAIALDIPLQKSIETVKTFNGLEHRLEFVAERGGVKFYNDSFSTNSETAMAAISSFQEPLFIILGGSDKNLDYADLAKLIAETENVKKIYLIGQIANQLEQTLKAEQFDSGKIHNCGLEFEKIFTDLKICTKPGDVVLLSPATASFGMFSNYKERGNKFKQLVTNL